MRYKVFGEKTGLRVSHVALGAGAFGTAWGYGAEPAEARRMLDAYLEAGGNFVDTADSYQFGESETLLGEFLGARRADVVLATKFTLGTKPQGGVLDVGNSRRHMVHAVEQSLKRLRTDRIDLYWVHMPDGVTPAEEIVRGLDDLARAGKIVYAGLSDFPAWRVARAATIAELRGAVPIAGLQIEYSLAERTPDRELLPMARALGLGTVAWSPLGGGLLTGKYRKGERGRANTWKNLVHVEDDPRKTAVLDELERVATETGANEGQVAIAWIMAQGLVPILGPRTAAQLADNLGALDVTLSAAQLERLDRAGAVPLGFPHEMLANERNRARLAGGLPETAAGSSRAVA